MTVAALQIARLYKALVSLAVILFAALVPGAAQSQTQIVAGMVAHGPPQWPQYIAMEFGWFKQDNIELDLSPWEGAARSKSPAALSTSPIADIPTSRVHRFAGGR